MSDIIADKDRFCLKAYLPYHQINLWGYNINQHDHGDNGGATLDLSAHASAVRIAVDSTTAFRVYDGSDTEQALIINSTNNVISIGSTTTIPTVKCFVSNNDATKQASTALSVLTAYGTGMYVYNTSTGANYHSLSMITGATAGRSINVTHHSAQWLATLYQLNAASSGGVYLNVVSGTGIQISSSDTSSPAIYLSGTGQEIQFGTSTNVVGKTTAGDATKYSHVRYLTRHLQGLAAVACATGNTSFILTDDGLAGGNALYTDADVAPMIQVQCWNAGSYWEPSESNTNISWRLAYAAGRWDLTIVNGGAAAVTCDFVATGI